MKTAVRDSGPPFGFWEKSPSIEDLVRFDFCVAPFGDDCLLAVFFLETLHLLNPDSLGNPSADLLPFDPLVQDSETDKRSVG